MRHLSRAEMEQIADSQLGKLLPGQTPQGVMEESISQKYYIGAQLKYGGRRFRYSQATAALAGLARLVVNSNYAPGVTGHANEDGFEGVLSAAAAIGAVTVRIADTAVRVANYYRGGMLIIFGTTIFHQHEIIASSVGNGTYVTLTLKTPITTENVTVAMGVTAYRSPYSAITPPGSSSQVGFETFMGVNLIPITQNYYFWLQTGGPCFLTPTGGTWPGSAANLRAVYPNPADGTIQPGTLSDPSAGYQPIGYIMMATGGTGSDYGDALVMLMLDQDDN